MRRTPISRAEQESYTHPSERSRFILAVLLPVPLTIIILVAMYESYLSALFIVLILAFAIWFSLSILKARLKANAVKVSQNSFPEIHQAAQEVKQLLGYYKDLDIYIIESGTVNAFFAKFLNTRYIILNSKLVEDMLGSGKIVQMKWILARFIGSLTVKEIRLDFLMSVLDVVEYFRIFNIFILPYKRATQYSGDNIGLAVCEDLEQVMLAFDKFLVGNQLSSQVQFEGIIDQGKEIRNNFFVVLARLFSPYPHTINRYLNLLAYAKWRFPDQFTAYVNKFGLQISQDAIMSLPKHYFKKKQQYHPQNLPYASVENRQNQGKKVKVKGFRN